MRTYKYRSYGIAALRVVDTLLVAACIRGLTAVKWSLDEGHVSKKVHSGAGREQVSRFNDTCDHVASKGEYHIAFCQFPTTWLFYSYDMLILPVCPHLRTKLTWKSQ